MWYDKYDLGTIVMILKRLPVEYNENGNGRYELTGKEHSALEAHGIKTVDEWANED